MTVKKAEPGETSEVEDAGGGRLRYCDMAFAGEGVLDFFLSELRGVEGHFRANGCESTYIY